MEFSLIDMASNGISSRMDNLDLSDTDTEDLFASPSRIEQKKAHKPQSSVPETSKTPTASSLSNVAPGESRYDAEEAREVALRKELAGIRNINQVVEGVVESLEKAKGNMDVRCCTFWNVDAFHNVYWLISESSPCLIRLLMPAPSCKHGPASSPRPSTTNASY